MSVFSKPSICRLQASALFLLCASGTLAALLTGATGCGMTKNLDEMHESTSEMATTTKSMNDKMDQLTAMNTTMTTMNGNMDKMLAAMDHMATGMDSMEKTMTAMATLMEQMTSMNQSMLQMKDEMNTMSSTLTGMNKTMSVMPDMKNSLIHMDGVMDDLNKKMISMDSKMDTLPKIDKTMNGMSGQIGSMKTQLLGLRSDLGTLKDMYKSLQTMQAGVGQLGDKMDGLNTMARGVVVDGKQGIADILRTSELDATGKADTLASKFAHASKYLLAFDYQILKGDEVPSQAGEEQLRADAVTEFFMSANGLTDGGKTIEIRKPDNTESTLLALAAAMHVVNSNMLARLKALGQNPNQFLSMLGMIEQALSRKSAIEKGAAATLWETAVLTNWQEAVYLLQLRENILAGVALQNMAELPQNPKSTWAFLKQAVAVGLENYGFSDWDAKTDQATLGQLNDYLADLTMASEAKSFLEGHGYETRIYGFMQGALKNCHVPIPSDATADRQTLLNKLQAQISNFTK